VGTKKGARISEVFSDSSRMAEIEAAWLLHKASYASTQSQIRRGWLDRHLINQRGRCAYCNVLMTVDFVPGKRDCRATIDHVVARARGGDDVEGNTVAACAGCNTAKADMTKEDFERHPVRLHRLQQANTPPDRLAADSASPFYDEDAMMRGVAVQFRGREREDVEEYCISEEWVRIPAGKALDRRGRPMTVKLKGEVVAYFRDIQGKYDTPCDGQRLIPFIAK
jgi:5-methylcytosine-specific restriction endonuclease McrA